MTATTALVNTGKPQEKYDPDEETCVRFIEKLDREDAITDSDLDQVINLAERRGFRPRVGDFLEKFFGSGRRNPRSLSREQRPIFVELVCDNSSGVIATDEKLDQIVRKLKGQPYDHMVLYGKARTGSYRPPRTPGDDCSLADIWKDARRMPAEAAAGVKPDFMDIRRPEGKRIMLRYPGGCVIDWVGPTGSHKTGAALAEALEAVTRGERVLLVALEGKAGIDTERLPAACAARRIALSSLPGRFETWGQPINILRDDHVEALIETFRDLAPTLIFVDVISSAIGAVSLSESSVGMGIDRALRTIAAAFDATVVALTHPPEGSSGNAMRALGSTLQNDLADATITFDYNHSTRVLRLRAKKMRDGEEQGFDVFMRNVGDGVPVIMDVPPEEWGALASRKATKEQVGADDTPPVDTPAAEPDADLRANVLAALIAMPGAGPHLVPAVVKQLGGSAALGMAIRRRMKRGCLADLALRGDNGKLVEPYAFRPGIEPEPPLSAV